MKPHTVIIGGGFAGLAAAKGLRRADVTITLIDKTNHHLFQPLLYQVATAGLAPSDIAEPIRSILARQSNTTVRLAEVTAIDLESRSLTLVDEGGDSSEVTYDKLVVAAGARHSYFGNDQWALHAPGLKTIGDALEIRRRVLAAFEKAEWETDPDVRRALMTFVVVGGGPTGVELAGAIAEIAFRTLRREYRNIDTRQARVLLLEGAHAVLLPYSADLQVKARRQLESLGVEVRLDAMVTGVDEHGVNVGDERIEACTVLWGAGVQGSPLARSLGVPLDKAGRVPVEKDLSVAGFRDVFVVGDLAAVVDPVSEEPVPGIAPAAMQMGSFVADCIERDVRYLERGQFVYTDRGQMATIGRSRAVAESYGFEFSGFFAWVAWVFVHIFFLITMRNRTLVMIKWAWAWATWERATRLVWRPAPGPAGGARDGGASAAGLARQPRIEGPAACATTG